MNEPIVLTKYITCMCEGGAEWVIIDKLLSNNLLIFERKDLIDSKILPRLKPKNFAEKYLNVNYSDKLTLVRIIDSPRECFTLPSIYKDRVKIVNVNTTPEIEMLIIENEEKYADFKKKQTKDNMKPSEYCKKVLGFKNVKSVKFVKEYFSDVDALVNSIRANSKHLSNKNKHNCLNDILKSN